MQLLDGKLTANKIKKQLKLEVEMLKEKYNRVPHLAIVLVGEVEASHIYVRNKIKACQFVGMDVTLIQKDNTITTQDLTTLIHNLNNDDNIDGIIVQLPLPKHIDEQQIINVINSNKDVDGFGIENKGKLFSGLPCLKSATPYGIIKLLEEYNIDCVGKNAVVVGRSNIVGKPMSIMLLDKHATVTICHSKTKNLQEITKQADILVVAIGRAKFITKDMVKQGAVVIDVGMNRDENGLCGDVDFEDVKEIVGYITPVPGGVGPLTITMLLNNTIEAFKSKFKEA